ncbi:cathepsin L1 [Galendromus occidentalis]|uniref:Cathepsin L1 n=1 Tax=Galendromus occidentalis TaxID=34638 RepID=A0AAJ7PAB6_9ACAR|nr:cathepsin L1 [Galendromus occidentalis]
MKLLAVLAVIGLASALSPNPNLNQHWENFKAEHNKKYESFPEELMRRLIFEENHQFIEDHNSKKEFDFYLGMNHFGDLTNKEYRERYLGYRRPENTPSKASYIFSRAEKIEDVPDQIDWRDQGFVTPVKNQGQCGSCWAFSAVGSLEGQHFKSTGKLVSLSEQNLVDCSTPEGNSGCNGGWMDQAFEYVKDNHGIDTEDSYPYVGTDGSCHFKNKSIGATLKGFMDVKEGDEEALRQAVGVAGPVSVAIDASSMLFQFYRGGVYNVPWCSTSELDHGVLVVGYGKQFQGKDFWMVKNSWGVGWGIYGYIEMSRNKGNQCGIASKASIPTV